METIEKVLEIIRATGMRRCSPASPSMSDTTLTSFTAKTATEPTVGGPSSQVILYTYGLMINNILMANARNVQTGGHFECPPIVREGVITYPCMPDVTIATVENVLRSNINYTFQPSRTIPMVMPYHNANTLNQNQDGRVETYPTLTPDVFMVGTRIDDQGATKRSPILVMPQLLFVSVASIRIGQKLMMPRTWAELL